MLERLNPFACPQPVYMILQWCVVYPVGPWKLYARWLLDSDKYNEWMNEIDYETEDATADPEGTGTPSPKKQSPSSY